MTPTWAESAPVCRETIGADATGVAGKPARVAELSVISTALLLGGCDPGAVTLDAAASGAIPAVTRHALTIHVTVDTNDLALADSLGWTAGVPGADVRLLANGTAEWQSLTTDSLGVAKIPVGTGLFRVYAYRWLNDDETSKASGVRRAFGDGRTVSIPGDTTVELRLRADQAGELLISEIGDGTALPWETGDNSYVFNVYFELFNNSPLLRYLDGLVFRSAWPPYNFSLPTPCSRTEATRNDSTGIHARALLRFPGSGTDFPIEPGEERLIAWSAIDHRPVHPSLPDLQSADFEITGLGAADNPAVPNLTSVGLELFRPQHLFTTGYVQFLAGPLEPDQLEQRFRDGNGHSYYYIPMTQLLDVVATRHLWPERDVENPLCVPMIHQALNRYEGGFKTIGFDVNAADDALRSLQRRVLRIELNGRTTLVNTNTTAVDFGYGPRTPGWVPVP